MSFDEAFPGVRAWLEEERGRKTALAAALAVRPHMLSAWLRGEGLPATATALALQRWFHQHSGQCPVCRR